MVRELGLLLEEREIPYNPTEHRIFCFPHLINIVVQHILSNFSKSVAPEDEPELDDAAFDLDDHGTFPHHPKTFEEARACDPLGRARKIILAIQASGQRRDKYQEWIKTGMQ